jgi:hypothetical protein
VACQRRKALLAYREIQNEKKGKKRVNAGSFVFEYFWRKFAGFIHKMTFECSSEDPAWRVD